MTLKPAAAVVVALAVACGVGLSCSSSVFLCSDNGQCVLGADQGVCQDNGLCSFPDEECATGQRYGEYAGPLAGLCVGAEGASGSATGGSGQDGSGGGSGSPSMTSAMSGSGSLDGPGSESQSDESGDPPVMTTGGGPGGGLVFWLPMEGGSLLDDVSGNNLHGECMPCPIAMAGQIGQAAMFVQDAVVTIPYDDRMVTPNGLTVSMWINPLFLDDNATYHLIGKQLEGAIYGSWSLRIEDLQDDGIFEVFASVGNSGSSSGAVGESAVGDLLWTHIAARWDGEIIDLWINGRPSAIAPFSDIEFDDGPVIMGLGSGNLPGEPYEGLLDDVRLYDRVLTDQEMIDLLDGG